MKKKVLLLDMDGVIADFHGAVCEMYGTTFEEILAIHSTLPHEYAIEKYLPFPISSDDLWRDIDANGQFWLNIEPYPWIWELWEFIRQLPCEVIVSTSPDHAPWNSAHKITWLRRHLPELDNTSWMIGKHKHLMANTNHVLLDDCEHNTDKFLDHGGSVVLFPQPWNKNHEFMHCRMDYVKLRLEELIKL